MKRLVRLLKLAHAIEIGAYEAYEGHMASIKPLDNPVRGQIKWIQVDELEHREAVYRMLQQLGHRPNPILDAVLYCIGRSISIACHFMGYKMALFGAKIMEVMGSDIYHKISLEARKCGRPLMAMDLTYMAIAEESHERYFKELLK